MQKRLSIKYSWVLLAFLPFLLGIETCGIQQFLTGETEKKSPTEPCLELIPTPTPVQIAFPATPQEPVTPPVEGTPIISDGEVVVDPTPIILPSLYTVRITAYDSGLCGGGISPPSGTVIRTAGSTINLSVVATMTCDFRITVDGITVDVGSWPASGSYDLTVTGNHSVYMCLDIVC